MESNDPSTSTEVLEYCRIREYDYTTCYIQVLRTVYNVLRV
jgi:hypothetical protein